MIRRATRITPAEVFDVVGTLIALACVLAFVTCGPVILGVLFG